MANNKKEKYKIDFKYNLSVFWSFLKKYNLIWITLLFLVLLIEGKQVLDKFLFKVIIDKGTEFVAGNIGKEIFINVLIIVGAVFIGATFLNAIIGWFRTHLLTRLESRLIRDLKYKFFNHIISLDQKFHVTHKTGSLISKLMRGSSAIERITDVILFNFAPFILQSSIAIASIIYFHWLQYSA